jgi:hypothetical protein
VYCKFFVGIPLNHMVHGKSVVKFFIEPNKRGGGYMKRYLFGAVVVVILVAAVSLSGQNLLQNPGFENWSGDSAHYWDTETTGYDLFKESGIVHSGNYSAKVVLKSTSTQRLTQYVAPVNPGNEYAGSIYFFDNDPYIRARLYIRWFDGSGGWISNFWSSYTNDSTEWQELDAGPDSAPALAETVHVEVRLYDVDSLPDSAIVYVDDATLLDLTSGVTEDKPFYNRFSFDVFPTVAIKDVNINLQTDKRAKVEISVYSVSGRRLGTIHRGKVNKGNHTYTWNIKDAPAGIYFIKARAGCNQTTEKVSIIR